MSTHECPKTINIRGQADLRNTALLPCKGDQGFNQIIVRTDNDGLSFDNFTGGFNISVIGSPNLQVINFPNLIALQHLNIINAPALTQVSLPKLRAAAETLVYPVTYTLTPSFSVSGALQFGGWSFPALTALGDLVIRHVPRRQLISRGLEKITTARSIVSDNSIAYPGLRSVTRLELTGYEDNSYFLPNLSSVGDFTFINAVNSKLQTGALAIDGSLKLNTSPYRRTTNETTVEFAPAEPDDIPVSTIDVSNITTIGANATIQSNANSHIDISGLATVGGIFSITNNTNCTIDLTKLSQLGNLSIVDNINSTIPRLFNLARAESIHLRGYIDTSSGPNILPSLTFVSGTVSIEPWNSDFSCMRLIAQQQQGLINTLHCNGTTASSPSPPLAPTSSVQPPNQQPLSTGAWIGIGIGIAVVVLSLLSGSIWIFLHFRRRFDALKASTIQMPSSSSSSHIPNPEIPQPYPSETETTMSGGGNEIQGRNIYEADAYSNVNVEKPSDPVTHELFVHPAELPDTHLRSNAHPEPWPLKW